MRAEITGIVVTDTKLFNRTGDIGRWAERVNLAMVANTKREAPHGATSGRIHKTSGLPAGYLRANIFGDVQRVGPRQLQTTISSLAPYSLYVLKGTGPIYVRDARGRFGTAEGGMWLPGNPGWGKGRWRQHVRGQQSNNFFERGFDRTARTHSSLRGYSMIGGV